jgi:two-component system sensor histidine kinase BaeS
LIDNAIKHTPAGGSVTVATAMNEDQIVLSVAVSAEGIDPGVLPYVFTRPARVTHA